jgi:hypothetical protein
MTMSVHDPLIEEDSVALKQFDPVRTYRSYLAAIARRDINAVLAAMTDEHARSLRELRAGDDFEPLFDLWCESQSVPVVIMASRIQGDGASLRTRIGKALSTIELRRDGARWRIAAETHD